MSAPLITSLQNQRVKDAAKLRDRRQREKQNRFLIDGTRELERALDAGVELGEVFVCPQLCATDGARHLLVRLNRECGERVQHVTPEVFEKLAFGERAEGIIAAAPTPRPTLDELKLPENPLVCVLECVEKPGNVGAILRSADAAGISAVITADERTDLFNPNTVRASLGTIFHVPTAIADAPTTLAWLRERGFAMWAARVGSGPLYSEVDYRGPTAIVLGSEAEGLSARWWADDIRPVHLPMLGRADSLNVSVAAAVMFYEALRQRGAK
ncbi:MAG: RNA methyltransferase [Planctomycetaceae bacterium]|nr:RNA methyltransferase [Planctomycetaceae bacterium]